MHHLYHIRSLFATCEFQYLRCITQLLAAILEDVVVKIQRHYTPQNSFEFPILNNHHHNVPLYWERYGVCPFIVAVPERIDMLCDITFHHV